MSTYIKIIHILICTVAALTIGVVLSLFIGFASMMNSFFHFPLQIYRNLQEQEKMRRLSQVFTPTTKHSKSKPEQEDIWDKHIRRMEDKKHNN
mgnify:CR=1 FL=1|tara:strand:+ start:141 stop:419 length:279 start_codon:yes stop_codon:yes gene_type:complete